jgi:hypothetical protein
MRIPNPRLLRLAGVSRGAIIEAGDGELIVTPVMQPVLELTSPLNKVFPNTVPTANGTLQEDSVFVEGRNQINGVQALTTTQIALFARGAWILEAKLVMQALLGATQNADFGGLLLADPDGNTVDLLTAAFGPVNFYLTAVRVIHVTFQRDNFALFHRQPAMANAGDFLFLNTSCNCRRVL